ncbi:unnamed protein product [Schistosoma guineensis]|nr:unnamed protein product [Schistosoma guineensis]
MNLSTINVTHSIESLSSSSSPELLNTNTMLTTNYYTINSNLPSINQTNSKLNGNELTLNSNLYHPPPPPPPQPPLSHDHHHRPQQQQHHHYHSNYQQENHEVTSSSSSSSSSSSALSSTSTSNGIISMNHLTNSLLYPFSSNFLLQESFIHLIYSTCFNIFDKRLNDELNKFNEKYELLFNEYNETKYRLNKLETIIQYHNKMNIPLIPLPSSSSSSFLLPSSLTSSTSSSSSSSSDYLLTSLNSLKSQHFNESIIDNNNNHNHNSHMMNTLKEIDTKWLMNWKNNNEDYLSSINSSKNNLLEPMLTTTTATITRLDEQQQQQQSIQRIKDKIKDNHPIEFDINHLSNSFIDSSMNENNVNYPKHLFHESNISRLHNHFYNFNNVIPSSSSSSAGATAAAAAAATSSALSINNQHLLWNQWMVNCINSVNGLLLSSSSSSSLSSQSILNNCEKINPFTMSDIDTIEGNQVSYS